MGDDTHLLEVLGGCSEVVSEMCLQAAWHIARTLSRSASVLLPSDVDVNIGKLPSRRAAYWTKQGALSLLPAVAFRVGFCLFVPLLPSGPAAVRVLPPVGVQ